MREKREVIGALSDKGALRKRLLAAFLISVACLAGAVVLHIQAAPEESVLFRPEPGKAAVTEELILKKEQEEKTVFLEVAAREYSEDQIEELHLLAAEYIEQELLGDNKEWNEIRQNLSFPTTFPKTGGKICWSTDAPWLVDSLGQVRNDMLTEAVPVLLRAEVSYGSEYRVYERLVTVLPKEYTETEQEMLKVQKVLESMEQADREKGSLMLPDHILGWSIQKKEENDFGAELFLVLLAVVVPLLVCSEYRNEIETREKKRKEQAQNAYSGFVTKFSLLLAAGVSVRQIFFRLAAEYSAGYGEEHCLTVELRKLKQELENGYSEGMAYELFGRRMKLLPYQRMAGLLGQNTTKGMQGIRELLLQEAREVVSEERTNIRVRGEQASTKLLLPMMGLLLLVFGILLVPAFQSF